MSELQALTVPKWGMSMEEGELMEWHVSVGDSLAVGDPLVDIETSKIVNTAESTVAGTLVRITGQVGDTLDVGALLGVVATGETEQGEIDAFVAAFAPGATAAARSAGGGVETSPPDTAAPAPTVTAAQSVADLASGPDDSHIKSSPVARRLARQHNINLNNVEPTGRNGRVSKWDVEGVIGQRILPPDNRAPADPGTTAAVPAGSTADDSGVAASPVGRRLATQLGINLHDVPATGRNGRVSKRDVERAAIARFGTTAFSEDKLSGMRRTIAARLTESKQSIPHFRVGVDVEIDSLLQQRRYMNESLDQQLSVNDFVLKACAAALVQVPEVNVQFNGDRLRRFSEVNIAMAVAMEGGLITPVLRNVAAMSLPAIAARARELAGQAQSGQLSAEDLQGGTFSVSNLGMYGVDEFDAIINPPQAAILAVAAGVRKAVVRGENLVPATVMRVTLSADHRAIDGAVAARFLQSLKGFLENPAAMLL